jgi:hypothetical protein
MRLGEIHNLIVRSAVTNPLSIDIDNFCTSIIAILEKTPGVPDSYIKDISDKCSAVDLLGVTLNRGATAAANINAVVEAFQAKDHTIDMALVDFSKKFFEQISRASPSNRCDLSVVDYLAGLPVKGGKKDEIFDLALASADLSVELNPIGRLPSWVGHDAAGAMIGAGISGVGALVGAAAFSALL